MAAAAATNSLRPFEPGTESWGSFMSRFGCFVRSNELTDVSELRLRSTFLNLGGTAIFNAARAIAHPREPYELSWRELKDGLAKHFGPPPAKIVKRFELRTRMQGEKENAYEYAQALRDIGTNCEYTCLDDNLLDQFIWGLRNREVQKKLMADGDITLNRAIEEARSEEASELAKTQQAKLQLPSSSTKQAEINRTTDSAPENVSDSEEDIHKTSRSESQYNRPIRRCPGCGGNHTRAACRFKDATCHICGKKGHISKVCRSAEQQPRGDDSRRREETEHFYRNRQDSNRRDNKYKPANQRNVHQITIANTSNDDSKKIRLHVDVWDEPCEFELDTGAAVTVISWQTLSQINKYIKLNNIKQSTKYLRDYQGNLIPTFGIIETPVKYNKFSGTLPIMVVKSHRPALLGMDWFKALGLSVNGINSVRAESISSLIEEFQDVFASSLGKYTGSPISFNIDPSIPPIRLKPRRVPFAIREKVDVEIDKLVGQGILEPIDHAKWETPIVTPIKKDGSIRICADYKCTLNRALQQSAYPVPIIKHLLHTLGPGNTFAKLDLAQAYQQLPVDAATAEAQTIVTHRGAFKCKRLQFGVSLAPGIFQSIMERLLLKIPGVIPYFDDVLITATDTSQLEERLRAVLMAFRSAGLRLKKEKCEFNVPQVNFLGYLINGQGIQPTAEKTKAIKEAPTPTTKKELQAFLGLLNFYNSLLQQKATVAEPLHRLLGKNVPWNWGERENGAFKSCKQLLSADRFLIRYNQTLPLVLTCDASPVGVGAVLCHRLPDGTEAPIAFHSRSLSKAEKNYSQIDKEALALISGIKKFHEYLFGRKFELVTDHKPLLGLISGDRPTPQALSPRMTRWTIFLAAYSYSLHYRPGTQISHADALSRCPLPTTTDAGCQEEPILLIDAQDSGLITSQIVATETKKDVTLSKVLAWVLRGWPRNEVEPKVKPYESRKTELATQDGCLLWGERVVIPSTLRQQILTTIHSGHPGIVRMKCLARSYVWWPGMDADIQQKVANCQSCQMTRPSPPKAAVRDWEKPQGPWSRVHIDLAGPFQGHTFLVTVDAYSKWMELSTMHSTTCRAVIQTLKSIFSTHGIPDIIVSDNGPQFTGSEFEDFLATLGIRHALTSPGNPSANGQAERMVRSAKESLKRLEFSNWEDKVLEFLTWQHITPCSATGKSPAELLMGRKLRSILDRLNPQYTEIETYHTNENLRVFKEGDKVYARNLNPGPPWVKGEILRSTGPKSYNVQLRDGRVWRRHIDQLRKDKSNTHNDNNTETTKEPQQQTTPIQGDHQYINNRTFSPPGNSGERYACNSPVAQSPSRQESPATRKNERSTGGHVGPTREAREQEGGTSSSEANDPQTVVRKSGRATIRPAYLKDYIF